MRFGQTNSPLVRLGEWQHLGTDPFLPPASGNAPWLCYSYLKGDTGQKIQLILDSSDPEVAMNRVPVSIGVFFYRGGRACDGDVTWNRWPHLYRIFDRLVDGGLFVTDGLNAGPRQSRAYRRHLPIFRAEDYNRRKGWRDMVGYTFKNIIGLRFTCVGYIADASAPAMIWQVRRV